MSTHFTFGVGLIGLAWWLLACAFKREQKAKLIPRGKALTVREPDELSVLSFNVLSDNLVRSNPCYNYANELYRSWEYRWDRIKEEITIMHADIVCLQEVEIEKWSEWRGFMDSIGYHGVLQKRQRRGNKSRKHQSISNATFYRKRRFTLCWEEHRSRVLGVGLSWKSMSDEDHKVYVINVHLEGHPYKPAERVSQVKSILKVMEDVHGNTVSMADVIFCGDFNSTRWNAPWQYLYRGRLEGGHTESQYPEIEVVKETTEHPYALQDVYKTAAAIPDFTTRAPRRRTEVDFIFCSRHLKIAGVLQSVDPRLIPSVDRSLLPNRLTPSDHFPIGAVLLHPTKSDLRESRKRRVSVQSIEDENETFFERQNDSVSSDNANNIDMNSPFDRNLVRDMDETTKAQKKFLETCVLPSPSPSSH